MKIEHAGDSGALVRQLTLVDAVLLVVSGTIGASIFITPSDVLRAVPNPVFALLLWAAAGSVTMIAGLACAELGGMFPEAGGQYIFIREAYGGFPAFLYGWVLFTAGNSGGLAAMAISVALFLGRAVPSLAAENVLWSMDIGGFHWALTQGALIAIFAVLVLTAVNVRSVKLAVRLQNVTAIAYLAVVIGIAVIGFAFGHGSWSHLAPPPHLVHHGLSFAGVGVAMIALLWSFDGWEFLSWVAGEIKQPQRNLPLALLLGILLIIATYLLANLLFLYALSPAQIVRETGLTSAAMTALFNASAGKFVSLFIALISFGAASVVVLGGARIYYSMARDGVFFKGMQHVHPSWNTPTTSLLAQCGWVIVLILSGRYDQLFTCFVFMMTLTYVATVGAVFVLRRTHPHHPRPYRCAGYPWLPLAYLIIASVFVISTLWSRPIESVAGLGMAMLGFPLYIHWKRNESKLSRQLSDERNIESRSGR